MKVTGIRLRLLSSGSMIAVGSVEFDESLIVNFRLVKGKETPFVKLGESSKGSDGNWYDSAYIKDKEGNAEVTQAIIEEYNQVLRKSLIDTKLEQTA